MKKNGFRYYVISHWLELTMITFIMFMGALCALISGRRSFNFDEFQVMYASASLVRGKAYYADGIETHFPFFNILFGGFCLISGMKTTTIIMARYFILLINGVTLFYSYRIGALIWGRKAGLLTVALMLSTVVFINKGLEIRHDVFNTLFNTIGCFYVLKYLIERKYFYLFISGLCLGFAIASTQKAVIGVTGIFIGVLLYFIWHKKYIEIIKTALFYTFVMPIPLILCVLFLILFTGDDFYSFFQHSIPNVIIAFAPHTGSTITFLHNRWDLLKNLIFQNNLFYSLGLGSIISGIWIWLRGGSTRIIVTVWSLLGILFYITAKRPFFQTFLPVIPSLAVMVGGMSADTWRSIREWTLEKKVGFVFPCLLLLFAWPIQFVYPKIDRDPVMDQQLANISFCLDNLQRNDKVFCFTQNQVFFDPVLKAGKSINEYTAEYLKQMMIRDQCKVIINDYRTRLLNNKTKKMIKNNYIFTNIGNIHIPGLDIVPKGSIEKMIWIEGYYYCPTFSLEINGREIENKITYLKKQRYTFKNLSNRRVRLVYVFKPENIINQIRSPNGAQ